MDKAVIASDKLEAATMRRAQGIYADALRIALNSQQAFFQKVQAVENGDIRPPSRYTDEQVLAWRRGYVRELMRKEKLVSSIADELAAAGGTVATVIKDSVVETYDINRRYATGLIEGKTGIEGLEVSFAQYDKRQIEILLHDTQPPFSKIAYRGLGKKTPIVQRLQNEMAQAVMLGESQKKIIERIRNVTGQSVSQARRVAQTERNRVQSQARFNVLTEAAGMGIKTTKKWSARMRNTRDTHAMIDGQVKPHDEPFGNGLMYPGEPGAPAAEVINCFCVLIPDVVIENVEKARRNDFEELPNTQNTGKITIEDATDFEDLSDYWANRYSIIINDDVKQLDFEAVKESMLGIERIMDEFPQAKSMLKEFGVSRAGIMSTMPNGVISFSPVYYEKGNPTVYDATAKNAASGWFARNTGAYETGSHEMGHLLERALIGQKYPDNDAYSRIMIFDAWKSGDVANKLVSEAAKAAKKTPAGKGKRIDQLRRQVSGYASMATDYQETLAECVSDYVANVENASPLSKAVWKILKERLG